MCQGAGANVALENDRDDDENGARKVTFSIYSVSKRQKTVSTLSFTRWKNVIFISIAEGSSRETFPWGGCKANEHHDWQHHGWVDRIKSRETLITSITCSFFLGNGLDIPLLGYREASREELGEVHELFDDECYGISQCFLLSTSQVTRTVIKVSFVITAQ